MANILCVYENRIATVTATENFFNELKEYDSRIAFRLKSVLKVSTADLAWCDILYMIRPNNAFFGRLAEEARKLHIFVVFFLDDDLLHLPEGNADMPWRKTGLLLAAKSSDIIVSSSPYICRNYSQDYGVQRTAMVDTAVPEKKIRQHIEGMNEKIKIVYAAGLGHKTLFDRFVKPIIQDLDKRCGDRISLTFMGVHPELKKNEYQMPIHFIESLPLNEYRKRIEQENFDIGLAPLITSEFTKCKYFNKFIEYAMFGIVGLYSDTEPYTFVVHDKENGLLVGDSPEDWLNAICRAVEDKRLMAECREHAYHTLRQRFNSKTIMDQFISEIPELVESHHDKQIQGLNLSLNKTRYGISRIGDWLYKVGYYNKQGGFREVCMGVKRRMNTVRIEKI